MINRLCIIGVGLIGGSLARALRAQEAVGEIVGCSRSVEHLQQAVDLGVIDRFDTDPAAAVAGADMVLVAVPMGAMEAVFKQIRPHLAPDAVITDVGSAKGAVVDAAQKAFGGVPANLVPGHPIAGTERSGVAASFAELFQQRRVILTPLAHTDAEAVERVRSLWETAGAEVVEMGVEHHDRVLAATSHLPHILAYATVDSLARLHEHDEIFQYAAGGFRDFTRIAGSDPVMWRDICLANREAILEMIAHFQVDLTALTEAIQARDGERLVEIFTRAKRARDEHAPH
ncbi:MAG: prephenate dehydrogenase [Gammaproteobacteria bacterium]|nr:prephenate dehydrogenase [Gammaproteobacteria bacterium]